MSNTQMSHCPYTSCVAAQWALCGTEGNSQLDQFLFFKKMRKTYFLCESSGEERIQILDIQPHKPFEVLAFYVLGFIFLLCELW